MIGDPVLMEYNKALPWPAVPADNPARVKQWATRVLIHMAAIGRSDRFIVGFAVEYCLDYAAIIEEAVRQAKQASQRPSAAPIQSALLDVEPVETIRDNRRKRRN